MVVHPAGCPVDAQPLYTVVISQHTRPNILVFRGRLESQNSICEAQLSSHSCTTNLSLHGHAARIKISQLSGSFSLKSHNTVKSKWKINKLTDMSLELFSCSDSK